MCINVHVMYRFTKVVNKLERHCQKIKKKTQFMSIPMLFSKYAANVYEANEIDHVT